MQGLASILVDGIAYGMILFMIAVGLSVTMGLMRVVNLAHGVFAMAGGYVTAFAATELGLRYEPAVLIGVAAVVALTFPMERLLYRPLYHRGELDHVLMTIGIAFLGIALCNLLFGAYLRPIPLPDYLRGPVDLGFRTIAAHRVFVIALGLAVILALWVLVERTRFGIHLRATVDNAATARTLGLDTPGIYAGTFALGAGLAALGGIVGAELLPLEPFYALKYLSLLLLVVAFGGLGSIAGSFISALSLGIIDTATKYFIPEYGTIFLFVVVMLVLSVRPHGLLGRP
jgi:branched-chain amino acid transport system permease protein